MEARGDVFQAIADLTRRAILGLLAIQSLTLNAVAENFVNELAARFPISRPAISKHVKVLEECGLIIIKPHGRERYCEVKLDQLNEVSQWVDQYRMFWEHKLDALELYLDKLQKRK